MFVVKAKSKRMIVTALNLIGVLMLRKLQIHISVKAYLLLRFYCLISGVHSNSGGSSPPPATKLNHHHLHCVHLAAYASALNILLANRTLRFPFYNL